MAHLKTLCDESGCHNPGAVYSYNTMRNLIIPTHSPDPCEIADCKRMAKATRLTRWGTIHLCPECAIEYRNIGS